MRSLAIAAAATLVAVSQSSSASAGELFGGLYKHDVDTPLTIGDHPEHGLDLQVGWRGGRIGLTPLSPYAFGSVNSGGGASYATVGLSAKFGGQIYVRPGLGLAVHTGSSGSFDNPFDDDIEFGSRILFAPELGVGVQLAPRISAEASWVHLSHGQLLGKQNPGMDNIGVRVNVALP